ncbi:MAG: hypothetical protein GY698_05555 [Actinomycetia bacterium]|nr:hypothetical protein [Actinomycetes bacterium]
MATWTPKDLLVEAWRSCRHGGARTSFLVTIAAVGTLVAVATTLTSSQTAIRFHQELIDRGIGVAVISASQGIPSEVCDNLGQISTVALSGAVVSSAPERVGPSMRSIRTNRVSGDLPAIWQTGQPQPFTQAPSVGEGVTNELGLVEGSILLIDGQPTEIHPANLSYRQPTAGRVILLPAFENGQVDECWLEFSGPVRTTELELLDAIARPLTGYSIDDLGVRPLIRPDETTRDPLAEYVERPSRLLWAFITIVLACVLLLTSWSRRREIALYWVLGTTRPAIFLLGLTTSFITTSLGTACGWSLAMAWALQQGPITDDQLLVSLSELTLLLILPTIAGGASWVLVAGRSPLEQLRSK